MTKNDEPDAGASDDPRCVSRRWRSARDDGRLSRRGYLQLLGAGTEITAVGEFATSTASGSSHYTTYTVNAGETFSRNITSDETFENVLIDITARDASIDVSARGSNWEIRNVGVKGRCTTNDGNTDRLDYYVRVTGSIDPRSSVDDGDVYSSDEAKGSVVNGGNDAYDYSDTLAALRVLLGNEVLSIDVSTPD